MKYNKSMSAGDSVKTIQFGNSGFIHEKRSRLCIF